MPPSRHEEIIHTAEGGPATPPTKTPLMSPSKSSFCFNEQNECVKRSKQQEGEDVCGRRRRRRRPSNMGPVIVVKPEAFPAPSFSSSRRLSVPVMLEPGAQPKLQPILQSIATGQCYLFIRTLVHEKARVMVMLAAVLEPLPSSFSPEEEVVEMEDRVWVPGQRVVVKVTDRRMVDDKPRASLIENPFDEVSAMQILGGAESSHNNSSNCGPPLAQQSHTLELLDALQDDDYLYTVMPFLPGRDLYQKIEVLGMGLAEPKAVHIFEQIVQGLRQMKKHRIAHRDVSLENVMFDEEGKVKIIDFGMCVRVPELSSAQIAETLAGHSCSSSSSSPSLSSSPPSTPPRHHQHQSSSSDAPAATTEEEVAIITKITRQARRGKALYVAPEVFHEKEYDPFAADVWSLGILLYILLTNRPLYGGPDDQAYHLICEGRLADLLDHYQRMGIFNVSNEARELLMMMLRPQAEERISLEGILEHPWMTNMMVCTRTSTTVVQPPVVASQCSSSEVAVEMEEEVVVAPAAAVVVPAALVVDDSPLKIIVDREEEVAAAAPSPSPRARKQHRAWRRQGGAVSKYQHPSCHQPPQAPQQCYHHHQLLHQYCASHSLSIAAAAAAVIAATNATTTAAASIPSVHQQQVSNCTSTRRVATTTAAMANEIGAGENNGPSSRRRSLLRHHHHYYQHHQQHHHYHHHLSASTTTVVAEPSLLPVEVSTDMVESN